ncbi:hypothetical protein BDD12DRAFT_867822 [Trichophaea hybrida]|nr:hypothetical protein BDD12DRAFT_867822 [Trichophaea hybrida]
MANIIPAGAYVIRNRETPAVLHYKKEETLSASGIEQDEEKYREQQVWWVEADPCYEELNAREEKTAKEGGIYRIANIAHSQSLEVLCGRLGNGSHAVVRSTLGVPWQLWRLRRKEYSDGEYYNIVSLHSGNALEFNPFDLYCYTSRLDIGSDWQVWEFVKPVASVPSGWLRLQNISSGRVLSQVYSSLPPISRSMPSASSSGSHHESWATQWAFVRFSALTNKDKTLGSNAYLIKNRLTGTYLRCQESRFAHRGEEPGSVNAWQSSHYDMSKKDSWRLELDRQSNWKIVHHGSGFLLEEAVVSLLNGNEVVCAVKTPDQRRSWVFVPIEDVDRVGMVISPPPAYNTTGSGSTAG